MTQEPIPKTLLERYRETLANHPNRTAFIWVDKNANETLSYTYEELDLASRAVAQRMMSVESTRDTVYWFMALALISFWPLGCLISGIVAAPVTPPISRRSEVSPSQYPLRS